jgi:hypothetical protein
VLPIDRTKKIDLFDKTTFGGPFGYPFAVNNAPAMEPGPSNCGLELAIPDRSWKQLSPSGVDELIRSNLSSSFHGTLAVLPIRRSFDHKNGIGPCSSALKPRMFIDFGYQATR